MTNEILSLINLNTVDETQLVKKLQISSRLAKRIIALRPYPSVDQLKNVWGIDPDTLQRILSLVYAGENERIPDQEIQVIQALPEMPVIAGHADEEMGLEIQPAAPEEEQIRTY